MSENIPALIDALRRKARFFERPEGEGENETELLLNQAAYALESLSAPPGDDERDRSYLGGIIHRTVPDDDALAHLCEDDDCLWYDIADAILAAGFRRLSPLTQEALEPLAMMIADFYQQATDPYDAAAEVLSRFAVPEPTEDEWEYGVLFPGFRTEPSFVGLEEGARYFMDRPADAVDKYATDADKRVMVRRVKAGPWVPVEKGAEQ